jgi:hypothetical protein
MSDSSFETLERHIATLGGVRMPDGSPVKPLSEDEQRALAQVLGGALPAALRWWFATYGAGARFLEPVVYADPSEQIDVLVDGFLTVDEIRQTLDDLDGALPRGRLPVSDDGSGNFLVVEPKGATAKHLHDAPLDRNEQRIADSWQHFLLMLRRGD